MCRNGAADTFPLLLELPSYRWPDLLENRCAGCGASDLPAPRRHHHPGAADPAVVLARLSGGTDLHCTGNRIQLRRPAGLFMQPPFAPLGFNWQMCIALIR